MPKLRDPALDRYLADWDEALFIEASLAAKEASQAGVSQRRIKAILSNHPEHGSLRRTAVLLRTLADFSRGGVRLS